jgi:hypothetical protein
MLIKLANSCAPRNIFTKTIHIDGTHDAAPSFEQRVASTPEQLDRVASQEIMRTPGITSMRMRSGSVAGACDLERESKPIKRVDLRVFVSS